MNISKRPIDTSSQLDQRSRADFRHFQASTEDLLLHVLLDVFACLAH